MTLRELRKYLADLESLYGNMDDLDVVIDDGGARLPKLEDIERVEVTRFDTTAPMFRGTHASSSDPPGWQRAIVIALRLQVPRGSVMSGSGAHLHSAACVSVLNAGMFYPDKGQTMRRNKVDVITRLKLRINALQARIDEAHVPYGGGNPYWHCKYCGLSDPQASILGREHRVGCPIDGLRKKLQHFGRLHYRAVIANMTPAQRRHLDS